MPTIQYPDVPNYAGVPPVPRTAPGSPAINVSIASQDWMINQASGSIGWGVYSAGNVPLYTPTQGGTLSFVSLGFTRSMHVSDFPIEANNTNQGAAFASFNKVYQPANPVVTLALSGTEEEKIAFLSAIDTACQSTTLWNVYTPDQDFAAANGGYTVERYSYNRSAVRGATMLIVEISFKEILQVTAALSNVANGTSAITSPQSPSAVSSVNNGITQTSTPSGSIISQLTNGTFLGNYPIGSN